MLPYRLQLSPVMRKPVVVFVVIVVVVVVDISFTKYLIGDSRSR